ncbi:MAG TPA: hypothetical protein VIW70_02465 [Rubrivivax sp.]
MVGKGKKDKHDGRKIWKPSPLDLKSYNRWYDYSRETIMLPKRQKAGAYVQPDLPAMTIAQRY